MPEHTLTMGGKTYDIGQLHEWANGRKAEILPTDQMPWFSRSRRDGFGPRRLADTDTAFPILLSQDGKTILDGKHRVEKHKRSGSPGVPSIKVPARVLRAAAVRAGELRGTGS